MRSFVSIRDRLVGRHMAALMTALLTAAAASGCARPNAAPFESAFTGMSVAVAPILNFSGQFDLDPIQAADLLASELTAFPGVTVLPVNRVVAALASEGATQIESPAHAIRVAKAVGADAIIVAGITEYDAYTPVIGLAVQMYEPSPARMSGMNADVAGSLSPVGQVQRTYNARHEDIVSAVRTYAKTRSDDNNPFGWQQYLKVQTLYLRFCWHDCLLRMTRMPAEMDAVAARGAVEVQG